MKTTTCPFCGSGHVSRLHRKGIDKLIPGLRKYECRTCRAEFITIVKMFKMKCYQGMSKLIALKQN